MNLARIFAVAKKEWREIVRDPIYLSLTLLLPLIMMFVFGSGMAQDVENVPLAILDEDKSAASRDYAQHFADCKSFKFLGYLNGFDQGKTLLNNGETRVLVVIPDKFGERLGQGMPVSVQTIVDGTITISIESIRGYVEAINASASSEIALKYAARQYAVDPARVAAMMQPVQVDTRYLYNEEVKSIWMIAPSLVMIILMWVVPMLMCLAVVREKETGSIYNIYSSTIKRAEFLIGKLIPVSAIAFVNALLLWAMAVYYFHAPFRGSEALFALALFAYVVSCCTLGLIASIFVQTQVASVMIVVILGAMVAMRYSGMFQPIADMDAFSRGIAHIFPAMYFSNVVEGAYLKGSGWAQLWPDVTFLCLYPFIVLGVGVGLFHKVTAK